MKRTTQNYDRPKIQVYNAMRDIIIKQKLDIVSSNKEDGVIMAKTATSYFFFGGDTYTFSVKAVSERGVQVTLSTKSDISQNAFNAKAKTFFSEMDKLLPVIMQE